MPCPKTQYLFTEYFADDLSSIARGELEKHIQSCPECAAELIALQTTQSKLEQWQDERVPHWDRGTTLFRQEHVNQHQAKSWLW